MDSEPTLLAEPRPYKATGNLPKIVLENRHGSLIESLSPTNGEKPTCFHDDHYTR
jgi:hypothetical protein